MLTNIRATYMYCISYLPRGPPRAPSKNGHDAQRRIKSSVFGGVFRNSCFSTLGDIFPVLLHGTRETAST